MVYQVASSYDCAVATLVIWSGWRHALTPRLMPAGVLDVGRCEDVMMMMHAQLGLEKTRSGAATYCTLTTSSNLARFFP